MSFKIQNITHVINVIIGLLQNIAFWEEVSQTLNLSEFSTTGKFLSLKRSEFSKTGNRQHLKMPKSFKAGKRQNLKMSKYFKTGRCQNLKMSESFKTDTWLHIKAKNIVLMIPTLKCYWFSSFIVRFLLCEDPDIIRFCRILTCLCSNLDILKILTSSCFSLERLISFRCGLWVHYTSYYLWLNIYILAN